MKNNKTFIKYTSRVAALSLALSLTMGGCSSANSRFTYSENENGEVIINEDSYIEYDYLKNYYVIEVYNNITDKTEIYIAGKNNISYGHRGLYHYNEYKNIFNNFVIVSDDKEKGPDNGLEYVSEKPLLGYITSYYTLKTRYTLEDMENIFSIVKKQYEIENDNYTKQNNALIKRRIFM